MKKKLIKATSDYFERMFQKKPEALFLSPGRINLIGEHVDYNDGYVLPAAINKYICFAVSTTQDGTFTLVAKDLNDSYRGSLQQPVQKSDKMWANYVLGVLFQLQPKLPKNVGFQVVFSSTIPMGAGLSSSAALECGFAYLLNDVFKLGLSKKELTLIGQQSEHQFVGVQCGIMDQYASVFGKKNKVILLDCQQIEHSYHPAKFKDYGLLLLDSHVKHSHLTSGYNDRRQEVDTALKQLQKSYAHLSSYRELTLTQLEEQKDQLDSVGYKRARFVVEEIQRVQHAVEALGNGDIKRLGQEMYATHQGLSKDYEVSCPELDFLVEEAMQLSDVIGSRMMGGGFGGCSINLVKKTAMKEVISKLSESYKNRYGLELSAYQIKISKGTHRVD
ncbi:MAG: galactokinase [Flavobacterium sp.]